MSSCLFSLSSSSASSKRLDISSNYVFNYSFKSIASLRRVLVVMGQGQEPSVIIVLGQHLQVKITAGH